MNTIQIDEMDEKILRMLIENARIPFLEVARHATYRVQPFISECNASPI